MQVLPSGNIILQVCYIKSSQTYKGKNHLSIVRHFVIFVVFGGYFIYRVLDPTLIPSLYPVHRCLQFQIYLEILTNNLFKQFGRWRIVRCIVCLHGGDQSLGRRMKNAVLTEIFRCNHNHTWNYQV